MGAELVWCMRMKSFFFCYPTPPAAVIIHHHGESVAKKAIAIRVLLKQRGITSGVGYILYIVLLLVLRNAKHTKKHV